jgi:hypothetical protein
VIGTALSTGAAGAAAGGTAGVGAAGVCAVAADAAANVARHAPMMARRGMLNVNLVLVRICIVAASSDYYGWLWRNAGEWSQ